MVSTRQFVRATSTIFHIVATSIISRRSTASCRCRRDFRLSCGRRRRQPVDRQCSRTQRCRITPAQPLLDHPSRRRCQLIVVSVRAVQAASVAPGLDRPPQCHSLLGKHLHMHASLLGFVLSCVCVVLRRHFSIASIFHLSTVGVAIYCLLLSVTHSYSLCRH